MSVKRFRPEHSGREAQPLTERVKQLLMWEYGRLSGQLPVDRTVSCKALSGLYQRSLRGLTGEEKPVKMQLRQSEKRLASNCAIGEASKIFMYSPVLPYLAFALPYSVRNSLVSTLVFNVITDNVLF